MRTSCDGETQPMRASEAERSCQLIFSQPQDCLVAFVPLPLSFRCRCCCFCLAVCPALLSLHTRYMANGISIHDDERHEMNLTCCRCKKKKLSDEHAFLESVDVGDEALADVCRRWCEQ